MADIKEDLDSILGPELSEQLKRRPTWESRGSPGADDASAPASAAAPRPPGPAKASAARLFGQQAEAGGAPAQTARSPLDAALDLPPVPVPPIPSRDDRESPVPGLPKVGANSQRRRSRADKGTPAPRSPGFGAHGSDATGDPGQSDIEPQGTAPSLPFLPSAPSSAGGAQRGEAPSLADIAGDATGESLTPAGDEATATLVADPDRVDMQSAPAAGGHGQPPPIGDRDSDEAREPADDDGFATAELSGDEQSQTPAVDDPLRSAGTAQLDAPGCPQAGAEFQGAATRRPRGSRGGDDGGRQAGKLEPTRFPSEQVRAARSALLQYGRSLPLALRLLALVGVLAVFGGPVALVVAATVRSGRAPRPPTLYVKDSASLRAGPGTSDGFLEVAVLQRGEPVQRLAGAGGSVAGFVLVRDSVGLVGFVPSDRLQAEAPRVSAKQPFTRCTRRPVESGSVPCVSRATAQFEACKQGCAKAKQCEVACEGRRDECAASCVEPPEVPTAADFGVVAGEAQERHPVAEEPVGPGEWQATEEGDAGSRKARKRKKRPRVKRKRRRNGPVLSPSR